MNGGQRPDPFEEGPVSGIPGAPTAPSPAGAGSGAPAAGAATSAPATAQPAAGTQGFASAFSSASAPAAAAGYAGASASPYAMTPYGASAYGAAYGSGYGAGYGGAYGGGGYGASYGAGYGGGYSSMLGGYGGGAAGYLGAARAGLARGAPGMPAGAGVLGGVQEAMARFARVSALVEDALRSLHLLFDALFGLGVSASAFSRELAVLLRAKTGPGAFIARCIRRLGRLWRLLTMVFVSPVGGRFSPVAVVLRVLGLVPEGEAAVAGGIEGAWRPAGEGEGALRLERGLDASNI